MNGLQNIVNVLEAITNKSTTNHINLPELQPSIINQMPQTNLYPVFYPQLNVP